MSLWSRRAKQRTHFPRPQVVVVIGIAGADPTDPTLWGWRDERPWKNQAGQRLHPAPDQPRVVARTAGAPPKPLGLQACNRR